MEIVSGSLRQGIQLPSNSSVLQAKVEAVIRIYCLRERQQEISDLEDSSARGGEREYIS